MTTKGQQNSSAGSWVEKKQVSNYDGSVKFVVTLVDGHSIEMVLMPEKTRTTLCLSSQVGCSRGCRFCNTARLKLIRNLSLSELYAQIELAGDWMESNHRWKDKWKVTPRVTNLVFMGMGEPLDNFETLTKFLPVAMNQKGFCIAQKNICVSTVGRMDQLNALHNLSPRLPVAISLHAGKSSLRKKLMPIESNYPLDQISDFIRMRVLSHRRDPRILIQVLLMKDVNNLAHHANDLLDFLRSTELPEDRFKKIKINLIPFNSFGESSFEEPSARSVLDFRDILAKAGLRVMVRYSKGQDIAGACGQLALK